MEDSTCRCGTVLSSANTDIIREKINGLEIGRGCSDCVAMFYLVEKEIFPQFHVNDILSEEMLDKLINNVIISDNKNIKGDIC